MGGALEARESGHVTISRCLSLMALACRAAWSLAESILDCLIMLCSFSSCDSISCSHHGEASKRQLTGRHIDWLQDDKWVQTQKIYRRVSIPGHPPVGILQGLGTHGCLWCGLHVRSTLAESLSVEAARCALIMTDSCIVRRTTWVLIMGRVIDSRYPPVVMTSSKANTSSKHLSITLSSLTPPAMSGTTAQQDEGRKKGDQAREGCWGVVRGASRRHIPRPGRND